jgi:DNA-binding NtrC family response regulator
MFKIVVAGRDQDICMFLTDELVDEGYDTVTILDPECVMSAVNREKPDLILLHSDSYTFRNVDLYKQLRNNHSEIPVISWAIAFPFITQHKPRVQDNSHDISLNLKSLKDRITNALGMRNMPVSKESLNVATVEDGLDMTHRA